MIKIWIRGLIGAAIGGAANSVTLMVIKPEDFNFTTGWTDLWHFAAISAVVSACLWLKTHPIPEEEPTKPHEIKIPPQVMLALVLPFMVCCASDGSFATGSKDVDLVVTQDRVVPLVETLSTIACGEVLKSAVTDPKERTKLAEQIKAVANGTYKLSDGQVPTPDDFHKYVVAFGGTEKTAQYMSYASYLKSIYAGYYPQIKAEPKLAIAILGAIARGADNGATAYATARQ